ncbi:MAG: STAS domain-containing protein [Anaerolineae bacterium]|nr:STAS domain-containing protein [Anaerolineae bacterium]
MALVLAHEVLEDGITVLRITGGSLDAPGTMSVEDAFQYLVRQQTAPVIVDLSGLDYMSSYGLRMLLKGAKAMHDAGSSLHLAAPNTKIMQVITISGYDTMFPVHESVTDALDLLRQP